MTQAMALTDYHTKYFAHELTKRCPSDSLEKLAGVLVDARVDLNPHQVDAALFAFRSPLSKGALLADEVGLGKTIEAGLVISQKWAEQKRRILIITPSNLRKQWYQGLQEKFFLSSQVLESRSYKDAVKRGNVRPFEIQDAVVICSYQFARSKAAEIRSVKWDLVVIDEAHRLRNVYKPANIIANTLKAALQDFHKLLLTATPLQNSLLELYGLVSFIDEQAFGDLKSFREQFSQVNDAHAFEVLKARIKPICHRTLRRQVTAYVSFTKRHPMVELFTPDESEDRLYRLVSEYLQRDNLKALPGGQRTLITLVLRKLLASSSFAISGAFDSMIRRLQAQLQFQPARPLEEELDEDYEALDETAEEWSEDTHPPIPLTEADREAIKQEIGELESFRTLAVSITQNAKGRALLTALEKAFAAADRLGADRKAIIFTESRRTQEYLLRLLDASPFAEGIVLFNGTNTDESSKRIYQAWLGRNRGTDHVTGSRTADMRSALVDEFRERGQILIATEAGAEGINLQFCSLVVNYDLPWNPQRIEQRIGRCHRYGQKHDVVVVNFLNQKNEADQRVFQLLSEKFQLFEGVFGASDEVLGAIESGVDFEKRIAGIYQRCRSPDEIRTSFDQLQTEMGSQIDEAITRTRKQLLENFDEEVHEKLRINRSKSEACLNRYERLLMDLTRHELRGVASFDGDAGFRLESNPFPTPAGAIPLGLYELPRRSGESHSYRLGHPLAIRVLEQAKSRSLPSVKIIFDHTGHLPRVAALDSYVGQSGELLLSLFTVESLDQAEDYVILLARTDEGQELGEDVARRLFSLPVTSIDSLSSDSANESLLELLERRKSEIQRQISERNAVAFEAEAAKLDGWADDLKSALEHEIKDLDRQIREAKRVSKLMPTLEEKLAGQKQIKALESQRNAKRRSLFEAQDEIDAQREKLIGKIEQNLEQRTTTANIFSVRWSLQ